MFIVVSVKFGFHKGIVAKANPPAMPVKKAFTGGVAFHFIAADFCRGFVCRSLWMIGKPLHWPLRFGF
jgi:hypothetical protein